VRRTLGHCSYPIVFTLYCWFAALLNVTAFTGRLALDLPTLGSSDLEPGPTKPFPYTWEPERTTPNRWQILPGKSGAIFNSVTLCILYNTSSGMIFPGKNWHQIFRFIVFSRYFAQIECLYIKQHITVNCTVYSVHDIVHIFVHTIINIQLISPLESTSFIW